MIRKLQGLTRRNRFLEIFNSLLLATEIIALLVMQPAELLQDLGMVRIALENTPIGSLGGIMLGPSLAGNLSDFISFLG